MKLPSNSVVIKKIPDLKKKWLKSLGESFGFVIAGNCSFAMSYCSCPAVCSTNCHGIIVYGFDFEMNKIHLEFLIVMSVT